MNRLLSKILPGTALLSVLLLSAGAWSMGPAPEHDVDRMLAHMSDELDLSDGQAAAIETLASESRDQGVADRQRMFEIRQQLKAMRTNFDAGTAQQLADELGEIASRTAYRMSSTQAQIYAQLNPDQQQAFDALAERREKRIEKRVDKYRR